MNLAGPAIHFLNVGYFFQLLYNLVVGFFAQFNVSSSTDWVAIAANFWLYVTFIAYLISFLFIGLIVYFTIRREQTLAEDAERYTTITKEAADANLEQSRWTYIRKLIESAHDSDWRQAIIEADIMLDEMLTKLGFVGNGVGDKLKMARETKSPSYFQTLDEAWTAHNVRNEIAHRGSDYQLSDQLAYRTIGHYENVFREFNEI